MKETGQNAKKGVKKAYLNAKGELCEWFKERLRCIRDKAEDVGITN